MQGRICWDRRFLKADEARKELVDYFSSQISRDIIGFEGEVDVWYFVIEHNSPGEIKSRLREQIISQNTSILAEREERKDNALFYSPVLSRKTEIDFNKIFRGNYK